LAGKIENVVSERSKILKFLADKLTPAEVGSKAMTRMLRTGIGVLARPGIQVQSKKSGKSFKWRSKRLEAHRDFLTPHFELLRKSLWAASTAAFMTWHEGRQWAVSTACWGVVSH